MAGQRGDSLAKPAHVCSWSAWLRERACFSSPSTCRFSYLVPDPVDLGRQLQGGIEGYRRAARVGAEHRIDTEAQYALRFARRFQFHPHAGQAGFVMDDGAAQFLAQAGAVVRVEQTDRSQVGYPKADDRTA